MWNIGRAWTSRSSGVHPHAVTSASAPARRFAVREHRALGPPGGAGGVADHREVAGRRRRRAGPARLVPAASRLGAARSAGRCTPSGRPGTRRGFVGHGEHRADVAHDVRELGRRVRRVRGHHDRAQPQDADVGQRRSRTDGAHESRTRSPGRTPSRREPVRDGGAAQRDLGGGERRPVDAVDEHGASRLGGPAPGPGGGQTHGPILPHGVLGLASGHERPRRRDLRPARAARRLGGHAARRGRARQAAHARAVGGPHRVPGLDGRRHRPAPGLDRVVPRRVAETPTTRSTGTRTRTCRATSAG